MGTKEHITEQIQSPKKGRPRKYATPEEAKEANRIKNIEGYYIKNKPKNNKYATIEEAEEAKRQKSLEYYYKNKEKCLQRNKEYKQKQRDLLKSEKLKQEITTD